MCIICVSVERDKMKWQEIHNALVEMRSVLEPDHVGDIQTLIDTMRTAELEEQVSKLDNESEFYSIQSRRNMLIYLLSSGILQEVDTKDLKDY